MSRYDILTSRSIKPSPKIKVSKKSADDKVATVATNSIADSQREELIRTYMRTAAGRARLAVSMANPMRQRLDHGSFARRMFRVDPLPQGAEALYDKVIDNPAFYIGEDGTSIEHEREDHRFLIPFFEIAANPSFTIATIRERLLPEQTLQQPRFALIERVQDLAVAQIRTMEEERSLMLLDAIVTENTDQNIHVSELDSVSMRNAFTIIERNDQVVRNIFMSARDYSGLRHQMVNFSDDLDVNTHRELLLNGLFANLWGAQIIVSRRVPAGRVYLTSDPEFTGVMPVRTELSVFSADDPGRRGEGPSIGWAVFETIGMGIPNPFGVAAVTIGNQEEPIKPNVPEIPVIHKTRYQILRGI